MVAAHVPVGMIGMVIKAGDVLKRLDLLNAEVRRELAGVATEGELLAAFETFATQYA